MTGDLTIYHYNPEPDPGESPIAHLKPGDRVWAVQTPDIENVQVGDPVTMIPIVVGEPTALVPPSRRRRLWAWITRRPVPEPEFRVSFTSDRRPIA